MQKYVSFFIQYLNLIFQSIVIDYINGKVNLLLNPKYILYKIKKFK